MNELRNRYIDAWQSLLQGDADARVVKRACRFSFALAIVGSAMMAVAGVGLLLA